MLNTYLAGVDVPIHLPGDDDNPTLFYIQPMNAESASVWRSLQELAGEKAADTLEDGTPESVTTQARARVEQQISFLASRISRIDNAPPDGCSIEGVTPITVFLRGLLWMQHNHLTSAFMDDNELKPLLFALTLFLELRAERDRIAQEWRSQHPDARRDFDPYHCGTCRAWNGGVLRRNRTCWLKPGCKRVQFGERGWPLMLNMGVAKALLPSENPLAYLLGDPATDKWPNVTADGKVICPVPLAFHPDLGAVLNMEADLDGWRTPPLAGPTSQWPQIVLDALRHTRGTKGLISMRQLQKPEASPQG